MNTNELIMTTLSEIKRPGIVQVMRWLDDSDFFTAPASTMFHGNQEGGLAKHSWDVFVDLMGRNERDNLGLDNVSIALCALLHDVCKVNLYVVNMLKAKGKAEPKRSTAKPYVKDDKFVFGHGEKSVAVLLALGLHLTKKEQMMIRWHMGPYNGPMPGIADYAGIGIVG